MMMKKPFDLILAAETILNKVYIFSKEDIANLHLSVHQYATRFEVNSNDISYEIIFSRDFGIKKAILDSWDTEKRFEFYCKKAFKLKNMCSKPIHYSSFSVLIPFNVFSKQDKEQLYKMFFGGEKDIYMRFNINYASKKAREVKAAGKNLDLGDIFQSNDPYKNIEKMLKDNNLFEEVCIASDLAVESLDK